VSKKLEDERRTPNIVILSFLREVCAEGRGLEVDLDLQEAVCASCGLSRLCIATIKPAEESPGSARS
jgi:hypothetical protein